MIFDALVDHRLSQMRQKQEKKVAATFAEQKGARKEVYGFVGWMTSFVLFGASSAFFIGTELTITSAFQARI